MPPCGGPDCKEEEDEELEKEAEGNTDADNLKEPEI